MYILGDLDKSGSTFDLRSMRVLTQVGLKYCIPAEASGQKKNYWVYVRGSVCNLTILSYNKKITCEFMLCNGPGMDVTFILPKFYLVHREWPSTG